jgi:hypothetical protein
MSTSLKFPDGLKDAECKKGQLPHQPPIPYVPVVDIVTPKEETQIFKIKLPDASHLSMHIYSRGNNKEYLAHIVAVLRVIDQKGLPKKCRVLAKADEKQSEALKNLQEAVGSRDTISTSIDITARKVEIEQTQQTLQEAQKAHDKTIAESYEQLRNLLSSNAQSQWDCVCCEMHERDLWAAVIGQVTKGRRPRTWTSFLDCLGYIISLSSMLTQPKGSSFTFRKRCASPRGPLCDSISHVWECLMTMSNTSLC